MREDGSPMPADGDRATAVATKRVTFRKGRVQRSYIARSEDATTGAPISSDRSRPAAPAATGHGALPQRTKRDLRCRA